MAVAALPPEELRIEVSRTVSIRRAPSQSLVRITHLPTGEMVEEGTFPTQMQNRAVALRQLEQRLGI